MDQRRLSDPESRLRFSLGLNVGTAELSSSEVYSWASLIQPSLSLNITQLSSKPSWVGSGGVLNIDGWSTPRGASGFAAGFLPRVSFSVQSWSMGWFPISTKVSDWIRKSCDAAEHWAQTVNLQQNDFRTRTEPKPRARREAVKWGQESRWTGTELELDALKVMLPNVVQPGNKHGKFPNSNRTWNNYCQTSTNKWRIVIV